MASSILFITCIIVEAANALIGYDCNGPTLNVSTFSTIDPLHCNPEEIETKTETRSIQLLQIADFNEAHVIQCKVEIDRTIYYCGMNSHVSVVNNGRQQYLLPTNREACRMLQATGSISVSSVSQIGGIQPNSTTTRSLPLAGVISNNGRCEGTTYSDPFGTWTNVVVQAVVKISLRDYTTPVKLSSAQIHLRSGQMCSLQSGYCLDSEDGHTYWDSMPNDYCKFNQYNVLYEGKAVRVTSDEGQNTTIYTVTANEATFALTQTSTTTTCGYTLVKTEHPKLLILETATSGKFKNRSKIQVNNLDIFTYINSKFIYVERHIKGQLTRLYRDIIKQRCELERQVLQNALTSIYQAPEEVAYAIMKQPGFMAIPSGEAIHIVNCIPVLCTIRRTEDCYNELPVLYKNSSYFLTPKHHMPVKTGTRRDCNELVPTLYKLQGSWYRMVPKPVETLPPQSIKPFTRANWRYVDPKNIASGGIYSNEDLNKLQEHIMFPLERTAVIHTIAQGATGREFAANNIRMYNLLDETSLQRITESVTKKMWNGFTTFGSATAGLIGIYIIIRTIKIVASTIVNGIALHSVYGWSIHVIAAVWNSLTQFFIFLKKKEEERFPSDQVPQECVPQTNTVTSQTPESSDPLSKSPFKTVREEFSRYENSFSRGEGVTSVDVDN